MAIPEELLNKWAKPTPNDKATQTYHKFKEIIESVYHGEVEVFLQGSYSNDTNIKSESDVDIVMLYKDVQCNRTLYNPNAYDSRIKLLRNYTYDLLNGKSNFILTKGSKTVKYAGNQNYLAVDLVPAAIYSGTAIGDTGIAIYDSQDGYIYYNHPKQHIKNGSEKNANTNGNYKKTVRMFKWAKEKLVEKGLLRSNRAPSYFIECLLYNVPNNLFVNNNADCFLNVLRWLYQNRNGLSKIKCQNGKHYLFNEGYVSFERVYVYNKWNIADAQAYINALVNFWNNWGK